MSDATDRLVAAFQTFGGEALRDVWLFDQWTYERLYVRDDVEPVLSDLDVEAFIDNERYGYVTRDTYESLYYADYEYTVRGFSTFQQFRTFFVDPEDRVGVFAGFDDKETGYDFGALYDAVHDVVDEFAVADFTPVDE